MRSLLTNADEIKIFILYLLDKIGYPLDYPSIGAIMMQDGIVNFFDFAECFFALVEAGLITEIYPDGDAPEKRPVDDDPDVAPFDGVEDEFEKNIEDDEARVPRKLYEVSADGHKVAVGLSDNLMESVREKSYRSALRHLSLARRGATFERSFEPDGDGYLLKCAIKDKDGVAMQLTVRADSRYQLDKMQDNFDERPEVIFRGIVALLSGDVNYLFEQ